MRNRLALALSLLAACKLPTTSPGGGDAGVEVDARTEDLDAGDTGAVDATHAAIDAPFDAPPIDAPIDAAPDLTAPSLVSVTPGAGTSVWLQSPIRLTFDEDLAPTSAMMTTATATVGGQTYTASVGFEPPRTLTLRIASQARGTGDVAIHVAPMVADIAGNVMASPIDHTLSAPAWHGVDVDRGPALSIPSHVVAPDGTVTAAWFVTTQLGPRVAVAQLSGSTWTPLGAELGVATPTSVSLALDEDGVPLVAIADSGIGHVARWTGTMWTELGSPGAGSQIAIVTPTGGHPIVALASDSSVIVRELVNETWQALGSDIALASPLASELTLASPAAAKAAVGWIDAGDRLRVYRLDAAWTALAPISVSSGSRMSLAARGGSVAIAYDKWAGSFGVLAALASGSATSFTLLGKPLDIDIAGDARAPAIALDAAGAPLVAWTELVETAYRGALARWSGSAWTIVGGATWLGDSTSAPLGTRLVLGAGDVPVLATVTSGAVHLVRFNGPRTPTLGLASRASLAGCSFDPAAPAALLSQTGCFDQSVAKRPVAHAGLVPYDVVAELWTDGARKRRWVALPAGTSMTLGGNGAWAAPVGTLVFKEFALETTPGNPATRRPVETRILAHSANGWLGFSYRWNIAGTEASLLADSQVNVAWTLDDGTQHTHVYPSRAHCRSCHDPSRGPLLGLRPEQLARWADYEGTIADQLPTLAALGVGPSTTPPAFTAPHDPSASTDRRIRGYMAVNCSHCHNPQYLAVKDLRYATPLAQTKLCETIVPGAPADSLVYQKVTTRPGMPPLGTVAVDPLAQELLGAWITGMTSCP